MSKQTDDFLTELRTIIDETLTASDDLSQCSALIVGRVVATWGGEPVYIKKRNKEEMKRRDQQVYRRFNGKNRHEICREFGISEVHFYSIIRRIHSEKQTDLFPKESNHE